MATVSMKCPNCGGELIFDPKSQKYKCEYCGSDFALDEISTEEAATQAVSDVVQEREDTSDNHTQQRTAGAEDAAVLYTCPSCGAQIVTDQTTAATFCYYCHNPVLLSEQLSGAFHPDQIIPFEIDRKQAEEHFLDFVQKKKFVPNAFFQKNQIEKLTGIYFPYWVCDAEVEGSLTAEGNKVRVWVSGDEEFTETRIYRMEREGHVSLREITKHALKKTDNLLAEGVLPYDFSKAAEFRMGYLSGFYAEKRDIERKELEEEVHREVENCTRDLLEDTIHGYNGVHILSDHIRPIREQWKYTLLPVWTVTYKGMNGKMYYYSMNGQNGKTYGELPVRRNLIIAKCAERCDKLKIICYHLFSFIRTEHPFQEIQGCFLICLRCIAVYTHVVFCTDAQSLCLFAFYTCIDRHKFHVFFFYYVTTYFADLRPCPVTILNHSSFS